MKTIFITLLIVFLIIFLIVYARKLSAEKLNHNDIEYIKARHIINHKNEFTKDDIKKAQQVVDGYKRARSS